jgi:hypothetical protein
MGINSVSLLGKEYMNPEATTTTPADGEAIINAGGHVIDFIEHLNTSVDFHLSVWQAVGALVEGKTLEEAKAIVLEEKPHTQPVRELLQFVKN